MPRAFFVAGTDTGVGKTRVALALLDAARHAGLRAVGMKPVAAGCRVTADGPRNEDAEALMHASRPLPCYSDVNPYAFSPAIAPHLAAREAGVTIALPVILDSYRRLAFQAEIVVVEGAGGWLAPIGEAQTMADIARALGLPVILVVGMRLGCLNHALLTEAAIAQCGLPLAGWIANCIEPAMNRRDDNIATLDERLRAPRLATLAFAPAQSPVQWSVASIDALGAWLAKSD